jgi:hypothetical protein
VNDRTKGIPARAQRSPEVEAFAAKLPFPQRVIVSALRRLVRASTTGVRETLLWRSISYHRPALGGRIAGAVCLITPRPDCVELGFIHGVALPDSMRLLRGDGKAKRCVPIRSGREIQRGAPPARCSRLQF